MIWADVCSGARVLDDSAVQEMDSRSENKRVTWILVGRWLVHPGVAAALVQRERVANGCFAQLFLVAFASIEIARMSKNVLLVIDVMLRVQQPVALSTLGA